MNDNPPYIRISVLYPKLPEDVFLRQLISCLFIQSSEIETALKLATTRLNKFMDEKKINVGYTLKASKASHSELNYYIQHRQNNPSREIYYTGVLN